MKDLNTERYTVGRKWYDSVPTPAQYEGKRGQGLDTTMKQVEVDGDHEAEQIGSIISLKMQTSSNRMPILELPDMLVTGHDLAIEMLPANSVLEPDASPPLYGAHIIAWLSWDTENVQVARQMRDLLDDPTKGSSKCAKDAHVLQKQLTYAKAYIVVAQRLWLRGWRLQRPRLDIHDSPIGPWQLKKL